MPLIIADVAKHNVASAIAALAPFATSDEIKVYEAAPVDLPGVELEDLAKKIVTAIRPQPNQPMRKEALQKLLGGHDTFWDQEGSPDPTLRNAMGAISKALKSVFPGGSGTRRLARPKKTWFEGGGYKGTSYLITPLGERVRELLKAEGLI